MENKNILRLRRVLKKLLIFFVSLFVLTTAVFFASRLTPLDPLQSYYGERIERMSPQEKESARERLGLTQGIMQQYADYLQAAASGDFGISYKYKEPVQDLIAERFYNTLLLGGIGFVLTFLLSLIVGIVCVWFEGRLLDRAITFLGTLISTIPEFYLSLLLIFIFSVTLHWLPSSGAFAAGGTDSFGVRVRHIILPLTAVILSHLWYYAYLIRNKLMEEARADYVLLERSFGLSKGRIMLRHCVRNIMPSYISLMALSIPHVLGGTYIVEMVFSYPGIGTLTYESARYADYNLLMLLCILTGAFVLAANLIGEAIAAHIDPRVHVHGNEFSLGYSLDLTSDAPGQKEGD